MTDSASADHTASDRPTRRALLAAGVVAAALAMTGPRPASAGTAGLSGLSDADSALAGFAISVELTARDLYDATIGAGSSGRLWTTLREQHEAYAQRLAGISGIPADTRVEAVYDAMSESLSTVDPADAALELENVAAATHFGLLGAIGDGELASAIASISAMESRHAAVLAIEAGRGGDLDALFVNPANPLSPEA